MVYSKDFWEIFWSFIPLALWLLIVFSLIMAAPSLDQIIWGQ